MPTFAPSLDEDHFASGPELYFPNIQSCLALIGSKGASAELVGAHLTTAHTKAQIEYIGTQMAAAAGGKCDVIYLIGNLGAWADAAKQKDPTVRFGKGLVKVVRRVLGQTARVYSYDVTAAAGGPSCVRARGFDTGTANCDWVVNANCVTTQKDRNDPGTVRRVATDFSSGASTTANPQFVKEARFSSGGTIIQAGQYTAH
jgi:hypothetical protein